MSDHDATGPGLPDAGNMLAGLMSDDLTIDAPEAEGGGDAQEARQEPSAAHDDDDDQGDQDALVVPPTARQDNEDEGDQEGDEPAEDDADDDGDEDEDEGDEPAETYTVKVDGQELQVTRQELLNGYQRQADYSRKTQELAEHRRAVEAERGQYQGLLTALHTRLNELGPDLQTLAAQGHPEAIQAIHQKQAAEAELDRLEAEENHRLVVAGQRQLLDWMPAWRDDTTRQKDFGEVIKYAQSLGYTPAELQNASDPRAILAMWKAAQYDKLKAEAADVRRTATKKSARVLKAGGSHSTPEAQKSRSSRNAMQRLRQTGSTADAAGILANMID